MKHLYTKGSSIAHLSIRRVALLSAQEDDQLYETLPQYPRMGQVSALSSSIINGAQQSHENCNGNGLPKKVQLEVQHILRSRRMYTDQIDIMMSSSIILALHIVFEDKNLLLDIHKQYHSKVYDQSFASTQDSVRLQETAWSAVSDHLEWDAWYKLVEYICRNMVSVSRDHPLITYANEQLFQLSRTELQTVKKILSLKTHSTSVLSIQKAVKDLAVAEGYHPQMYVALLEEDDSKVKLVHSCIPTAQLEFSKTTGAIERNEVALVALYNIGDSQGIINGRNTRDMNDDCATGCGLDNEITICRIPDGTVEERDRLIQRAFGHSCLCIRCQYEMNLQNTSPTSSSDILHVNNSSNAMQLGRFYMSQGKLDEASAIFGRVVSAGTIQTTDTEDYQLMDIWHALGAVQLSQHKFLAAQRTWKDACDKFPTKCDRHAGITLARIKNQAYAYNDGNLSSKSKEACGHQCSDMKKPLDIYENEATSIPFVFLTNVTTTEMCRQVIQWANEIGTWTQARHYAVPTYDIAIHTVPVILEWFQRDVMSSTMQDVLAQQFQKGHQDVHGKFYVHDAFCVRYEAGSQNNHLPVHTDESTHSLVLALNDDFEGGGTYFFDADKTISPSAGSMLSFRGGQTAHGGQAVTKGERYIIAAFLYYDSDHGEDDTTTNTGATSAVTFKRKHFTASKESEKKSGMKSKLQRNNFSFGFEL